MDLLDRMALAMVRRTAEHYGDAPPVDPDLTLTRLLAKAALDELDGGGNFANWIEASRAVIGCPDASLEECVYDLRDAMPTEEFQSMFAK